MAIVPITNLRGPAARIVSATSETVPADQPSDVIMTGPDQNRSFHFKQSRGLPGVNAVANDSATATYVAAGDSATAQALAARYADTSAYQLRRDPGMARFAGKFSMGLPCVIQIVGDSTGNETTEWAYKLMQAVAAAAPTARVEYDLWADATKTYATTVYQAGSYVPPFDGQAVLDTFTRTGALAGSAADTGQVWATNGAGAWTLDGSKAVLSNVAGGAVHTIDSGKRGEMISKALGVELDTTAAATTKQFLIYCSYASNNDHLWVYVSISTTGVVSWGVFKRIGGTATQIATGGALGLTPNAVNTFDVELGLAGTTVTAIVNGVTVTATLSSSEAEMFITGNAKGGIGTNGLANSAGIKVTSFSIGIHELNGTGQLIKFRNGSHPGATIAYHQTNLATVIPAAPDVVYFSLGHNQGASNPATYIAAVVAYMDAVKAAYPTARFVAVSQNPQFPPLAAAPYHAPRLAALRDQAFQSGWGYLPAFEAFWARPDHGQSLVASDGVHPLVAGSNLWAKVAIAHFAGNSR